MGYSFFLSNGLMMKRPVVSERYSLYYSRAVLTGSNRKAQNVISGQEKSVAKYKNISTSMAGRLC